MFIKGNIFCDVLIASLYNIAKMGSTPNVKNFLFRIKIVSFKSSSHRRESLELFPLKMYIYLPERAKSQNL